MGSCQCFYGSLAVRLTYTLILLYVIFTYLSKQYMNMNMNMANKRQHPRIFAIKMVQKCLGGCSFVFDRIIVKNKLPSYSYWSLVHAAVACEHSSMLENNYNRSVINKSHKRRIQSQYLNSTCTTDSSQTTASLPLLTLNTFSLYQSAPAPPWFAKISRSVTRGPTLNFYLNWLMTPRD